MLSNTVSASHFFPFFIALEKLDYINSLEMCAVKIITYCRGSTFPPGVRTPSVRRTTFIQLQRMRRLGSTSNYTVELLFQLSSAR